MNEPVGGFFIIGCPRTGSTLLRRILSAHSQVAIPPESLFIFEYLAATHLSLEDRKSLLVHDPALDDWGLKLTLQDFASCHTMADCIRTIHRIYAQKMGKTVWGNKTPIFVHYGELLAEAIPEATFIHMVRDARAVANSLKQSTAHRMNLLIASRRYNRDTAKGLLFEQGFSKRTHRVVYEDMVQEPEKTLRALCRWLHLDFEPPMLDASHGQNLSLIATETKFGHHQNIARPIDSAISEKWRKELTPREIGIVTYLCRDTMEKAGYCVPESGIRPSRLYLIGMRINHLLLGFFLVLRNLWTRPRLYRILRRKVRLGSLGTALNEIFAFR